MMLKFDKRGWLNLVDDISCTNRTFKTITHSSQSSITSMNYVSKYMYIYVYTYYIYIHIIFTTTCYNLFFPQCFMTSLNHATITQIEVDMGE